MFVFREDIPYLLCFGALIVFCIAYMIVGSMQ